MRARVPSTAALIALAYRHYPRGVALHDPRHRATDETRRLACVYEAAAIACGKQYVPVPDDERVAIDTEVQRVIDSLRAWKDLGARCRASLPGSVVWDKSGPFFDPGYTYAIAKPEYVHPSDDWYDPVFCVVSALAPVFAIYTYDAEPDPTPQLRFDDFPARYHPRIEVLTALVAELLGFAQLDGDTLQTIVPDVVPVTSNCIMGEATLMDLLLTSRP